LRIKTANAGRSRDDGSEGDESRRLGASRDQVVVLRGFYVHANARERQLDKGIRRKDAGERLEAVTPKKKPKLREDMAETARRVFLESIGEAPKTLPPHERTEKNPEAVERGRRGGRKGGSVRAAKLSPDERKAVAKKAAKTRWKNSGE
jgi:hypothetical protein